MLFTTSWDDGSIHDRKLTGLLGRFGMKGTLYVSKEHPMVPERLSEEEMHTLPAHMELGAHTMTHPDLTVATADDVKREIADSKRWIESLTGKPCDLFCYPRGRMNNRTAMMVRDAGFRGARTTELYRFSHDDKFRMPVSLHVYPFPLRRVMNRRAFECFTLARREVGSKISLSAYRGWLPFAKALFAHARASNQPYFHLFGHSWEIEHFGMWSKLEKFFEFVSEYDDVQHVKNSDLLSL